MLLVMLILGAGGALGVGIAHVAVSHLFASCCFYCFCIVSCCFMVIFGALNK